KSPEDTAASVRVRLRYLRPFLQPDVDFMEVGAGDCSLALEAARHVRTSLAVEVSDAIAEGTTPPANFKLLLADAVGLSLDSGSLDVIYSNDFLEHLHPDDAINHVRRSHALLRPGGVCLCLTPNRITGPHDISGFFDEVATGLHLKEYS